MNRHKFEKGSPTIKSRKTGFILRAGSHCRLLRSMVSLNLEFFKLLDKEYLAKVC